MWGSYSSDSKLQGTDMTWRRQEVMLCHRRSQFHVSDNSGIAASVCDGVELRNDKKTKQHNDVNAD